MYPFTKFIYVMKTKELHRISVNSNKEHAEYIQFVEKIIGDHFAEKLKGKSYYSYVTNALYWADQQVISYEELPDEVKTAFALCT